MKTKMQNATRSRKTLAKAIAEATDSETENDLVVYGRVRSPIERVAQRYLETHAVLDSCAPHNPAVKDFTADCERQIAGLTELITEALNRRDGTPLRVLADVVEAFDPVEVLKGEVKFADTVRALILCVRDNLNSRGKRMAIADLAWLVNWRMTRRKDPIEPRDDGFSALRRIAKQLRFPLEKGQPGRALKIKTPKDVRAASKS